MKSRRLAALGCAMVLSLSAASVAFANENEQGYPEACATQAPTAQVDAQCEEATSTPSEEATSTPSEEATSTPSEEATSTPSDGAVEAVTGTPSVTLPATDRMSGDAQQGGSGGVLLAVLAMAGLLAAVLLLTPAKLGLKRGKRD